MNSEQIIESSEVHSSESIQEYEEIQDEMEPINRWGSQVGLIYNVYLLNERGKKTTTIEHGETVKIKMSFNMPEHVDLEHFRSE
ncbi:Wzt carbohydrate-binding domain-containing protein, partial [Escherichia coli]|uniref:Wzt carbohydrate-binding domain-containing protein n=1 Tax=Escherichia coli TaxID=562 RepID=UPI00298F1A29